MDRTYLRRFNFFKEGGDVLSSRTYAEGFQGRSYFSAEAFSFQDLRSSDRPEQPSIAPIIQFSHRNEADSIGGRFGFEANVRSLYRGDGPNTQRISLEPSYGISNTSDAGIVTTLLGSVLGDLYYVNQTDEPDVSRSADTGVTGRILPRLTLGMRYPFAANIGSARLLVEPATMFTATLNGQNSENIPNEDSPIFEDDDTNLWNESRLPGEDRIEDGQRAVYGLKLGGYSPYDAKVTAFVGQSYRLHTDAELRQANGIEDHFSDIVGRVDIVPNPHIDVLYRFALNRNDLSDIQRNEINFNLGPPALRINGYYTFVAEDGEFPKREELKVAASAKISDHWFLGGSTLRDLAEGQALKYSAGLRYEDECLLFELVGTRSFFKDEDVDPYDSLLFRIKFKYLGETSSPSG